MTQRQRRISVLTNTSNDTLRHVDSRDLKAVLGRPKLRRCSVYRTLPSSAEFHREYLAHIQINNEVFIHFNRGTLELNIETEKSMNKNCPVSGSDINMQRRFPNEISSIVVDYLVDDPPALQNVALLCHDFAILAQSRIFEQVNLEDGSKLASGYMPWSRWSRYQRHDYVPLMYRFNALLSNPQTGFLGKFVRRLDLDPCLGPLRNMERTEVDVTISSIFQQLPALTELRINHGRGEHFGAVETADPITSYLPAMISVTRGIEGPNLTLCCSQFYQLIAYFAHFISIFIIWMGGSN
ncbi:hypothetical protein LENED_001294 [Lentinula edodes]|nr:hypothetical protein LENED_001294 [Lentinula edodes]